MFKRFRIVSRNKETGAIHYIAPKRFRRNDANTVAAYCNLYSEIIGLDSVYTAERI
jgi:hypothetical protein